MTQDEAGIELRKWHDAAPRCFSKYTELQTYIFPLERIEQELQIEFPDSYKRVISLLRSYACSEKMWNAYPSYEDLPFQLLRRLDFKDIMAAYLSSERTDEIRKGLGRYVCCYKSHHQRKGFLKHIAIEVMDELDACFRKLNDQQGPKRVATLRKEKEEQSGV